MTDITTQTPDEAKRTEHRLAREAGYRAACQEMIDWCEKHLAYVPKDHPDVNGANYAYRAAVNRIRDVARVMLALPEVEIQFSRTVPQ